MDKFIKKYWFELTALVIISMCIGIVVAELLFKVY